MKASMLILLFFFFSAFAEDYYKMLGVARDADEKVIKKAFKKLSLEHHPDRGDNNSEEYFMKLSHAYEALTTPEKREIYDRYGEEGLKGGKNYNHDDIYSNYFGHKDPHMRYHHIPYYEETSVIRLDGENIKNLHRRNEIWMVKFYGPRSRLCQEFKGQWIELANRLSGVVKVAAVDCDQSESLCIEYNIKKYPVIIYFPDNTVMDPEVYQGEKTTEKMADFALSQVKGFMRFVNSNNIEEFLQSEPEQVKIIAFTNIKETIPLIKAISKEFKGQALFGEARASDLNLVQRFNLTHFPAVIEASPIGFQVYPKPLQRYDLEKWVFQLIDEHKVVVFARELNRGLFLAGNCNAADAKFCLIVFDPDSEMKQVLDQVSIAFASDPIGVFWVNSSKFPGFSEVFQGKNVVYRGKKQKYSEIQCGKDFECYKEVLANAISGGLSFTRVRNTPDLIERKAEL